MLATDLDGHSLPPSSPPLAWVCLAALRWVERRRRVTGGGRLSDEERSLVYIFPKKTSLQHRLASSDALFVEFISQ